MTQPQLPLSELLESFPNLATVLDVKLPLIAILAEKQLPLSQILELDIDSVEVLFLFHGRRPRRRLRLRPTARRRDEQNHTPQYSYSPQHGRESKDNGAERPSAWSIGPANAQKPRQRHREIEQILARSKRGASTALE